MGDPKDTVGDFQEAIELLVKASKELQAMMDKLGNCVWCRGRFSIEDDVVYDSGHKGWSHQHCYDNNHTLIERIDMRISKFWIEAAVRFSRLHKTQKER